MTNTTFIHRKIKPVTIEESDQNTWTQNSFHHSPFPFGAIVTIFCFGSATPSPRHELHAVRVSTAHCGTDAFDSCCRASVQPGTASLRPLKPARRVAGGSLATQTRDAALYLLLDGVRGEHSPDAVADQRTTAAASPLRHRLWPGSHFAFLRAGRICSTGMDRAKEPAPHSSRTERGDCWLQRACRTRPGELAHKPQQAAPVRHRRAFLSDLARLIALHTLAYAR